MLLCLVMLFTRMPVFGVNHVKAATISQNNITACADYMYNLTWVPMSTV